MNYNALCVIQEPSSQVTDADALQQEHTDIDWPEQRCRASLASIQKQVATIGVAGVELWDIRLQPPTGKENKTIRTGWHVRLQPPGETAWRELAVIAAIRTQHWHLTCQGVG